MKTHLSFPTASVDGSVTFYRALLDAAPTKHYADYALFVIEDPGLELALQADASTDTLHDAHYGIVTDAQGVEDAIRRLQEAGFAADVRSEETCCYAVQTKVWTSDPDGRRWEVYTVHEELSAR
jgi:catechol 2,3-dioxygenase-like lactoylglutathione lyase family enzyme